MRRIAVGVCAFLVLGCAGSDDSLEFTADSQSDMAESPESEADTASADLLDLQEAPDSGPDSLETKDSVGEDAEVPPDSAVDDGPGADTPRPEPDTRSEDASPRPDTEPRPLPQEAPQTDRVFYAGGEDHQRLYTALQLSDGTFLIGGVTEGWGWVPDAVVPTTLEAGDINGWTGGTGSAFVARLASDLSTVLSVLALPVGVANDIRHIRASAAGLYVSGTTAANKSAPESGYFIAKLNGDFVASNPTGFEWVANVWATGQHQELQPWDVDDAGRVTYVRGQAYEFDWAAVHRLAPDGQPDVVEHWRTHWGFDSDGGAVELRGTPASDFEADGYSLTRSGIVFKAAGRCELRSWTEAEYAAMTPDGNGGERQGTWPNDAFYSGPCDPNDPTTKGPGYTGYNATNKTHRIGSIAVDRATGRTYIGYSIQSTLPGGNPDFEPAVVAFDADGALLWWSRLYEENEQNSTPDQYVDRLAIDAATNALVVAARCHGNNVVNLWEGNTVAAKPGTNAFQNQFTGTSGNIHISWLGRLDLADGTLLGSSYVAEFANGMDGTGEPSDDPNLDGWPSPNAAWPKLNTTRVRALAVGPDSEVLLAATGRRVITTAGAFQKMPKASDGQSGWSDFARVYPASLSTLTYSSILRGTWDPAQDGGGSNVEFSAILPTSTGLLVVGWSSVEEDGAAKGEAMPTTEIPSWGGAAPSGEDFVIGHFLY